MTDRKKLNVLELRSCRGGGGGPEKTILFSALEADRASFNVTIVYLKSEVDPEFDLHARADALGIESFLTIDERFKFDIAALRKLLEIVRERQIDILHSHCYKSDLYALILRRFHAMKLVTTAHGPLATFKFFWASQNWKVRYLYDQIDLRILRHFDVVLMVSDTMRETLSRHGIDPGKLICVRNAIDCNYFSRRKLPDHNLRAEFGIPPDAFVVGAVGRLNGEKDYPNFIAAAEILIRSRDNLYFVIAGKGELEQALRKLVSDKGLTQRVIFLGHMHDVRKAFEMLDVYVLSSTREGLPNTVLEAMAMEIPIVATDVDGVKEAVADHQDALLIPPCDSMRLANGIGLILDDVKLRELLRRNARRKVESEFSFAKRTRKVEDIYRRIMST